MNKGYLSPSDWRYNGDYFGDKGSGLNVQYASDPYWGEKAAAVAQGLDEVGGNRDWNAYIVDGNGTTKRYLFEDVKGNEWYYPYVDYVNDRGIMTGLDPFRFGVSDSLKRAQFATIMYRMAGKPAVSYQHVYADIGEGEFYTDAVIWAKQSGVMTGYENGLFGPSDEINREQMATTMYRYAKYCKYDISQSASYEGFPDANNVNAFASEAMKWAIGNKIIQGDNGMLNPQGTAIRAHGATIITRFMQKYAE